MKGKCLAVRFIRSHLTILSTAQGMPDSTRDFHIWKKWKWSQEMDALKDGMKMIWEMFYIPCFGGVPLSCGNVGCLAEAFSISELVVSSHGIRSSWDICFVKGRIFIRVMSPSQNKVSRGWQHDQHSLDWELCLFPPSANTWQIGKVGHFLFVWPCSPVHWLHFSFGAFSTHTLERFCQEELCLSLIPFGWVHILQQLSYIGH